MISPSFVPCDINNDGNMDLVVFDQTADETEDITEGIFLGKGDGTFEVAAFTLLTPDGSPAAFNLKAPCNAEIIDIDNDARLDIILAGHEGDTNCNVILHNQSDGSSALGD